MSAREEYEAFIWRALTAYHVTAYAPVQLVDALLRGADKYAIAEGGITAQRRAALGPIPGSTPSEWKAVHFGERTHACHKRPVSDPQLTTDPARVTCARCKQTRAYAAAMAGAVT